MSDLRFLLRYVYGKLHELSDRGTWHGTYRATERSLLYIPRGSSLAKHAGMAGDGNVQKKISVQEIS